MDELVPGVLVQIEKEFGRPLPSLVVYCEDHLYVQWPDACCVFVGREELCSAYERIYWVVSMLYPNERVTLLYIKSLPLTREESEEGTLFYYASRTSRRIEDMKVSQGEATFKYRKNKSKTC